MQIVFNQFYSHVTKKGDKVRENILFRYISEKERKKGESNKEREKKRK